MQAYCLQRILEQVLPGAKVEIIDYRPRTLEVLEYRRLVTRRPPFFRWQHWSKLRDLRAFVRENMTMSSSSHTTDDTRSAAQFISRQNYDVIVVGSDTVWEIREGGNVPPAPNIFFLPGVAQSHKVAFAVSADPVLETPLLQEESRRHRLRELIETFDAITIRDRTTRELVSSLGVEEERLLFMPDPTLLWDFSSLVDQSPSSEFREEDKPLAGVATSEQELRAQVTQQLRGEGFNIINLLGEAVEGQKAIPGSYGLRERLGVYRHLDFMVTDRFHGSLFTLKIGKAPVIFIERGGKWPKPNSKGRDLFTRLGLEEAVWRHEGTEVPSDFIRSYQSWWKSANPNIHERLDRLAEKGEHTLVEIQQAVLSNA